MDKISNEIQEERKLNTYQKFNGDYTIKHVLGKGRNKLF